MRVTYPLYKTSSGASVDLNHLIDNNKYFKRQYNKFEKFDSSVYCILTPDKQVVYYGKGKFNINNVLCSRGCTHKNDLVSKYLKKNWTILFIAIGITDNEARALEALLIKGKKLSKINAKTWDGVSLMNKRYEHKGEELISKYLIYGNNTRFTT